MALFRNINDPKSRAVDIISQIKPKTEEMVSEEAVEDVVENPPTPQEVTPEVESTPPTPPETEPKVPEKVKSEDNTTPPSIEEDPVRKDSVKEAIEDPSATPVKEQGESHAKIDEQTMLSFLSEKLNRKVESLEDLTITEQPEIDPEVKQLLDWKEKTGLSLSQWPEYNKDFSKMGDLEVAREILAQEYPNLTKEEINYSLRDYIYDEDLDDPNDKVKKNIELKKLAQEGRASLEKKRLELTSTQNSKLSQEQLEDLELAKTVKQQQQEAQINHEKYKKKLQNAALSLEPINLQLTDDLTIKYDVSEGERKALPDLILNMPTWYNKDGSLNHANIVKDGLKIKDFDAIVQKAFNQGVDFGKESKIKADKNITIDTASHPLTPNDAEKKGNITQVIDKISGNRGNKLRFGKKK